MILLDLKCFSQGHIYNTFTKVSPSKRSATNSNISASAFELHELIWIDLGFHVQMLGHASLWYKAIGTPQLLFGVSHGNLRGRSQPGE